MMPKANRQQRRAAKKGDKIFIDRGPFLLEGDKHGLPVVCFACGASHRAFGLVRIRYVERHAVVPLCAACVDSSEAEKTVARKFLNAPQLEMREGGELTSEEFAALVRKQDATEH